MKKRNAETRFFFSFIWCGGGQAPALRESNPSPPGADAPPPFRKGGLIYVAGWRVSLAARLFSYMSLSARRATSMTEPSSSGS